MQWIGRRWTMARGFTGEELSGGKQSGGDALGSRRKQRGGSGVAVLRAREGERSSLRTLCSVEWLDAEWAGEAVRRGAGGTPSSGVASTREERSDGRGAHWGGEPAEAAIGEGARAELLRQGQ